MKQSQKTLLVFTTATFLVVGFQNCSKTQFTDVSTDQSSKASATNPVTKVLNFSIAESENPKVDILFVIDNSLSMMEEQLKISQVFSNFTSHIANLDYRIAITTTDNQASTAGAKGSLLPFISKTAGVAAPANTYFIDKNTMNMNQIFIDTINTGTGGSGVETGLYSIRNFLNRTTNASSNEAKFMRADALFTTIVVSDSDQAQYSKNSVDAASFLSEVKAAINGRAYVNHASVALPGDTVCKSQSEVYGSSYYALSLLTGGINASICDANYADQFQMIAQKTIEKVSEKTLDCAANKIQDVFVRGPSGNILSAYQLNGNILKFISGLSEVGSYQIKYTCLP